MGLEFTHCHRGFALEPTSAQCPAQHAYPTLTSGTRARAPIFAHISRPPLAPRGRCRWCRVRARRSLVLGVTERSTPCTKRAAGYLSRRGRAASRASCSGVVPRGTHNLRPRALAHSTSGVIPRVELHAELKLPGDQFVEAANSCVRHAEIRRRASLEPHGGCG